MNREAPYSEHSHPGYADNGRLACCFYASTGRYLLGKVRTASAQFKAETHLGVIFQIRESVAPEFGKVGTLSPQFEAFSVLVSGGAA